MKQVCTSSDSPTAIMMTSSTVSDPILKPGAKSSSSSAISTSMTRCSGMFLFPPGSRNPALSESELSVGMLSTNLIFSFFSALMSSALRSLNPASWGPALSIGIPSITIARPSFSLPITSTSPSELGAPATITTYKKPLSISLLDFSHN